MIFFERITGLLFLSALCGMLVMGGVTGCALQREGTCGEGEIVCSLYKKEYRFTTEGNTYLFEGACEIENDDNLGSTFNDPYLKFVVRGQWERQTKEFAETVKITGNHHTKMAITGFSSVDPWLHPYHPVGISALSGDPQAFADNLCLQEIPPEYSLIPFSRNVIIHILTAGDLANLLAQASNPTEPTPPPAPPCPSLWVTGPPEMNMPKPGLVYKENVKGVTVYLLSRCGSKNVEYAGSEYQVFFERAGNNGWEKFRGYKVDMSYSSYGGSIGSDTLPLDGPGKWRLRARHITKQRHQNAATIGDFGDWVEFWVGQPKAKIGEIDTNIIKTISPDKNYFRKMERAWDVSSGKPILSSTGKPTIAADRTTGKLVLKTRPMVGKVGKVRPSLLKEKTALIVSDLKADDKPLAGDFVDLVVTLSNISTKVVGAGEVTLALNCAKKPSTNACAYRLDSFLLPDIASGETWTHRVKNAIRVNDIGGYKVTATTFGPGMKPSMRSVSFSAHGKATLAPKRRGLRMKKQ